MVGDPGPLGEGDDDDSPDAGTGGGGDGPASGACAVPASTPDVGPLTATLAEIRNQPVGPHVA